MSWLDLIKVGDKVVRMIANVTPMTLIVTEVTPTKIICGPWTFDKQTGGEIDEDLGWDGKTTGSALYKKDS